MLTGVDWEARTDEWVGVMRAVWGADHASHSGELMEFSGVSVNPKPVDRGGAVGHRVPAHIGGPTPVSYTHLRATETALDIV